MSEPVEGTARLCPICGKQQDIERKPFCSKRCADIDLGRWLKGNYIVPGREVDEDDRPPPSGSEDSES